MFGESLMRLAAKYAAIRNTVQASLADIQTSAVREAVRTATEMTPPDADLSGAGTRTGEMKSAWATDSIIAPLPVTTNGETSLMSRLANNKDYASYVNDGHRMSKHFVPGLMVNPYSGMLERVDPEMGGLTVGTKTHYVPGIHMADYAKLIYSDSVERQLSALLSMLENDNA